MSGLPSGTVTFLFTDIEGSTQRWQQQPVAMGPALARHDRLIREAIEANDGVVFKTVGDAFCAAFADPSAALAAALAAQRALYGEPWGATGPLRVRMALHTGRAEVQAGDYAGAPLNRVARLLSAGHGGQVLLSGATAELVQDHLPTEVHLRDLGTHQLKDLYRPERIFQLVTPDLPADFSPLASADHLPPYPAQADAADHPASPVPPARSMRRRAAAVIGGLVVVLLALGGVYIATNRGDPAPAERTVPATTVTAIDPFAEGSGTWGTLATPPAAPAVVVLGNLVFNAAWKGSAQTLPGPMFAFVPDQPVQPTVWFGGAVTVRHAAAAGTPGREETIAPDSYVNLLAGDELVVPADTPFAITTGPNYPAALVTLIIFPSGPPVTAPDALQWEWLSWGTVEAWPPGPLEVRFQNIKLAPGESASLPAQAWPQLVYADSYDGPALRLMLAAGGGETMPAGDFAGRQLIDFNARLLFAPGMAGTPQAGMSLQESRHPIIPGTESAIGGILFPESAFLHPGTSGTLRNPNEGLETVGIVILTFGQPGTPN